MATKPDSGEKLIASNKKALHDYFEDAAPDPFMQQVYPVRPDKRAVIPAVTHVDYSARVQTVDEGRHGRFYRLVKAFEDRTGCPVLINTSFNVRGEPIVLSPEHAYRCFTSTNMDALVLERSVLLKRDQPSGRAPSSAEYVAEFQPD